MSKKISNVAMVIDCLHSTPKYSQSGYPIVRVEDVDNNFLNFDNCLRVSFEDLKHQNKKYVPQKGDIIITRVGSFGRLSYIDTTEPFCLGQNISIICPKVDSKFLYYYLKSPYAQKFIFGNSNGSSYKSLSLEQINEIPFVDDHLDKEKIGALLYSIDKKIANNSKINSKLESLAKTLYDYWFLQFEFPNEEGKPYKSSGGKIVYNEQLKKEIPEGWEVADLMNNNLCSDIKAGVDKFSIKNYLPTANVNGEDIVDGENITFDNRENRANMQPIKYSVWFAKMKNSIKHISIPCNSDWFIQKYILSTGFQGLQCNENSFAYIHSIINSSWFEKYKDTISHGATQEGVNNEDLKNVKFVIPTSECLKLYNNILLPILEKKFSIIKENQELTKLHNFLLPLLMNGQVTIQDAEEQVNNVIKTNKATFSKDDERFELWLQNQGIAARGDVDRQTLREIFDSMDEDDK